MSKINIPSSYTIPKLKQLAFHAGLARNGTKGVLQQRIRDAVQSTQNSVTSPPPVMASSEPGPKGSTKSRRGGKKQPSQTNDPVPPKRERILSIDMGIRNFGLCLLSHEPLLSDPSNPQPLPSGPLDASRFPRLAVNPLLKSRVLIHAWYRLDLAPGVELSSKLDLPAIAVALVQNVLLPLRPTRVVIEKQRFRSAGAAAVMETTVMVNTLETALHTCFQMLAKKDRRNQDSTASTFSVDGPIPITYVDSKHYTPPIPEVADPKAVAGYWLDGYKDELAGAAMKKAKMQILGYWLQSRQIELVGKQPFVVATKFLKSMERKRGGLLALGGKLGQGDDDTTGLDAMLNGLTVAEAKKNKKKKTTSAAPKLKAVDRPILNTELLLRRASAEPELDLSPAVVARYMLPTSDLNSEEAKRKGLEDMMTTYLVSLGKAGKLDDLADCVLQGVYVLRCEENRRKMLEEGVESFIE